MKTKTRGKLTAILMSLAMVFTMMPMMTQSAHAVLVTIKLDGGSYTLTGDNKLVKDGTTGNEISILSNQKITVHGDTVIKLNGYTLKCASIKSGFENPSDPDIGKHPWYSYDLTIDGGDMGGSIQIGDSTMDDYAVAAYNLTIRNLSADSTVSCLRESGNKVAIYAYNDLRIEGIKKNFGICGAIGMEARDGITNISDVSGFIQIDAKRNGINTDDTNKNDIKISSSNVVIGVDDRDGNCINSGWKKGGISITDSIVKMSNSNNNEPTSTSKGGYNALSVSGIVEIKDSYVTAENRQKDRPAMFVYEDTGKLIISGESMLGCQNVEGGSASALMAKAIELKDDNRLSMPKGGSIGTTTYNSGPGSKEYYTVFDKDGNTAALVGLGSGKELINTISAPSKVLPGRSIHMCGVLRDEDGNPVPDFKVSIYCKEHSFEEIVQTDDQGRWQYTGNRFRFSDPGQVTFRISVARSVGIDEMSIQDLVRYAPPEDADVNVQVISAGVAETLFNLELSNPPQGESRKTEYKCGERFDPKASYVKASISFEYAGGGTGLEARDLEPGSTTITPAVLDYGTEEVSITYMFGGQTASIECPITVVHDWSETPLVNWTADGSKTTGDADYYTAENVKAKWTCSSEGHEAYEVSANGVTSSVAEPTCGVAGKTTYTAVFTDPAGGTYTATKDLTTLPATGHHSWDGGRVTKAPTVTATGIRTYSCANCGNSKTEIIAKLPDPAKQYGSDGTPVGPGASSVAADKAITKTTSDKDIKGSAFAPLKLKSSKQGKGNIKLSWAKNSKATKYVVYGNLCNAKGKKYKPVKLATVTGGSCKVKKIGKAKVKKGSYYKFVVVALDKNNNVVSTSKMIHVATKGGKAGNHKSVTVKAKQKGKTKTISKVTLAKGKSLKLTAKQNKANKKLKVKKHVGLRYESSNAKVATVSGGKITAKGKGSCHIYVYTQNGASKAIKVTVK